LDRTANSKAHCERNSRKITLKARKSPSWRFLLSLTIANRRAVLRISDNKTDLLFGPYSHGLSGIAATITENKIGPIVVKLRGD